MSKNGIIGFVPQGQMETLDDGVIRIWNLPVPYYKTPCDVLKQYPMSNREITDISPFEWSKGRSSIYTARQLLLVPSTFNFNRNVVRVTARGYTSGCPAELLALVDSLPQDIRVVICNLRVDVSIALCFDRQTVKFDVKKTSSLYSRRSYLLCKPLA